MKRTTLIFLTILTLSVLLTACGRDNGAVSTDPNGIIGNNQTSQPDTDTPQDNAVTDPFDDALDEFPFGVGEEPDNQPEQPTPDAENAVEEQDQTADPQVRKRSSGTGMTGGQ